MREKIMNNLDDENQISCLVDFGTVYAKRDMARILRDLEKVQYYDFIDDALVASGEGYMVEVYANSFDSTVIFNHRIHVNVNSFDYLKLRTTPKKEVELFSGHRVIRLLPLTSILDSNKAAVEEEMDEQRIALTSQMACDNEVDLSYRSEH